MNYRKKKRNKQLATLKKYGLYDDFKASGYKYLSSYLKVAYRQKKIKTWGEVYGNN